MMEKGTMPIEYKGKSLEEIDLDPNLEYAEDDGNESKPQRLEETY